MNGLDDTTSRHAKLASDSVRVCIVFPKETMKYIRGKAEECGVTVSRIVREYVDIQITKEKDKCLTNQESA